jgi:putative ABC transport system permease protein
VSAVGAVNVLPVSGSWWTSSIWIEGREAPPDQRPVVNARVISGEYLAAIGIPLLRGRDFRSSDNHLGAPVVLIDESAARSFWPGEDPIGKRIAFGDPTSPGVRRFTVVGIVGKIRQNTLTVAATPMAYMPLAQAQFGNFRDWGMSVVLRTEGRPTAIVAAARRVVGELDPALPVFDAATLEAHIAEDLAERRFTLTLVSIFAAVAMILAALGVYGVLSYVVAERTREIAMRIALGADRSRILAWVLRGGMLLAAAGLAVGIGLSAATSRFLSTLLYEVSAKDPITFAGIALTLSVVAFAACLVPALRATRVDPMAALKDT